MNRHVRAVGRSVRSTRAARWAGDQLMSRRYQYRIGTRGGRLDRLLSRMIKHNIIAPEARRESVEDLIELFFSLVEAAGIDAFVEAGAKDGGASSRAVSEFGLSNVVAFEANPYTHKRFHKRLVKAGVKHEHLALSETSGTVEFLVRLKEDGTPIADGQGSLLVRPDHTPGYESVSVEAVTLDEYYADDPSASFAMWVDVEGASSQVLRGGSTLLSRTDLVFIEVEDLQKWDGQEWLHDDVVGFFSEHGLKPVARDTQSRHQFNVLFVSDRALGKPEVSEAVEAWRSR